jgi:hypothetical protein
MNNYTIWAIIAITFIVIGGFIGWHMKEVPEVTNTITLVPARVNFDSLYAIWSVGKTDSVLVTEKEREIASLQEEVNYLANNKDTVIKLIEPVKAASKSFDTTITTMAHAQVIQSGDTTEAAAQTEIDLKVHYIPGLNLFKLEKLNVKPFTLWLQKEKETITVYKPTVFGMQALGGWMGSGTPAAGGMVRAGWLSAGAMAVYKHSPLWLVGVRIGREL